MKKDIFIDNNIAKNFTNPMDPEYKKLIQWLRTKKDIPHGKEDEINAHLAVSQKLLMEYKRSSQNASSATNIGVIFDLLLREGRLVRVSKEQINSFKDEYFTKAIQKRLLSNTEDQEHIPVVLLSYRKYALSIDDNFLKDLVNFPKHKVTAAKRPENIPYAE